MKKPQLLTRIFILISILSFGGAVLLGIGYAIYRGLRGNLHNQQLLNTPPSVIVHAPSSGDTVLENDVLPASATASGINPISRLELWIDSEMIQQEMPDPNLGADPTSFRASFELDLAIGIHMVVFRAVDNQGLIGQSLPIPITVEQGETTKIEAQEGDTLNEIAQAQDVDPEILENLNPGIGQGGLAPGTNVVIPAPPPPAGNEQTAPAGDDQEKKPNDIPPDIPVDIIQPDPLPVSDGVYVVVEAAVPVVSAGDLFNAINASSTKAPTAFQAGFKDCAVQLQWYDNAENETHFNIWMQRVYGPPQLIATTPDRPGMGPTEYIFKSPSYGFYNFWVEAVNAISSQPSEIIQVFVSDQTCATGIATSLEIVAEDMFVFGGYNSVYCYLSLEGHPNRRIPEDGQKRINLQNGFGDITNYWGEKKSIAYVMPADGELTLEGECLGEQGGKVFDLGVFRDSVQKEKWDGSRLELKSENDSYIIGYHVKPLGSTKAQGAFSFVNYDLDPPTIWSAEAEGELNLPEKDWKARTVTVKWHWAGNPDDLISFLILIDGQEFRHINKIQRQESIIMGSACGQKYTFQLVAIGPGGARSTPSMPRYFEQEPCPVMAEVQFLTVSSTQTDDQSCEFPLMHTCLSYKRCDEISVYYELFALGAGHDPVVIKVGTPQYHFSYKCGIDYQFIKQLGATVDTIVVPIDPNLPEVRVGSVFWESDLHEDDVFGRTGLDIKHAFDQWPSVDEDFVLSAGMMGDTADLKIIGHIRGFYYPGP